MRFFEFIATRERPWPRSFDDLDEEIGEYINDLYLDDLPQGWGGDLVCAFKRFYPKCRRHLTTSELYLKNWARVTARRRAIPASRDLIIGMASAALLDKNVPMAFCLLLSFVGLLRVSEVLTATPRQFALLGGGSLLTLALPDSKGAKRQGMAEQVTFYDPTVLRLAAVVLRRGRPHERILGLNYPAFAAEVARLGRKFGVDSPRFTPYCLRRGGATWHFTKYASYDATQHLGRWAQAKTAKQYIDQATAEATEVNLPDWGKDRLDLANRCFAQLLEEAVGV